MANQLKVEYDPLSDTLTIEDVEYSGEFLRHMAKTPINPDELFKIVNHTTGIKGGQTVTIQVVRDRELAYRFDLVAKAGG